MVSQLAGNITKVNSRIELSVFRSTATQAVVLKWLRGCAMWYCQPRGVAAAVPSCTNRRFPVPLCCSL